jgi:hypothetical protein
MHRKPSVMGKGPTFMLVNMEQQFLKPEAPVMPRAFKISSPKKFFI